MQKVHEEEEADADRNTILIVAPMGLNSRKYLACEGMCLSLLCRD